MSWWGPEYDDTGLEGQFLGTILLGVILFFILRACTMEDRPIVLSPAPVAHPYAEASIR